MSMKKHLHLFLFTIVFFSMAVVNEVGGSLQYPVVVSTWPFLEAVRAAWKAVEGGLSAVDAVVEGCSACEKLRCDGTGIQPLSFLLIFLLFHD
ncbi:probable isoaspartyl peptidase/L-asparaginase 3 [Lycium ferocissimum]|uniref:probable isoaspartyl peptidase/L-asparaginase 3 n=1 Tax=Lycium ferocissimum TaxID=112874 RepID=UPI0028161A38|nr:probable isoaspartyl peptidase/L-asparaginase 3 [Lycium ferocissimum]